MPAGGTCEVQIGLLADHPPAARTIATWLHREWLRHYGYGLPEARAELRTRLQRDALPIALVACAGRTVVGTASISKDALSSEPEPRWCLSGLYVSRRWRRRGIATGLCAQARALAARLGLSALPLYTLDQAGFFSKRGWQQVATTRVTFGDGERVVTRMEPSSIP